MSAVAAAFVSTSAAAAASSGARRSSKKNVNKASRAVVTSATSNKSNNTADNNATFVEEERSSSRREAIVSTLAAAAFAISTTTEAAVVTRPASAASLPKMMVVGATGQTGQLVVAELRKRGGAEVVAAVRSLDKAKKMGLDAGGVTLLPGFDVTGRGGEHLILPSPASRDPSVYFSSRLSSLSPACSSLFTSRRARRPPQQKT